MPRKPKDFFLKRMARYLYLKLVRTNDSPHSIALGAAIGIFIAVFPTFGIGLLLAVFFAFLFKANKASALLGTAVFGAGFLSPLYWGFSLYLGKVLLGLDLQVSEVIAQLKAGEYALIAKPVLVAYLIGNVIISSVMAAVAYLFFYYMVSVYKKRKFPNDGRKV